MSFESRNELVPTFELGGVTVVSEGDEVYVWGIGGMRLGVGTFAGSLALYESSGVRVDYPIIEVQGELVDGGAVDVWSTDPKLIEKHRHEPTYPIAVYMSVRAEARQRFQVLVNAALMEQMGVALE